MAPLKGERPSTASTTAGFSEPHTEPLQSLIHLGSSEDCNLDNLETEAVFSLRDCPGVVGSLDQLLVRPNAGLGDPRQAAPADVAEAVISLVNGPTGCVARSAPWGKLVPVGNIQFLDNNGRTEALGPGRYVLRLTRATWTDSARLNENRITSGSVSIVRIPNGMVGLAREAGNVVLLDAGLHVHNNPSFVFERMVDVNSDHINHGTLHIVRVSAGKYAKVWVSSQQGGLQPRLLVQGLHIINSSLFSYDGQCSVMEQHLAHGTINVLRVPKGSVGKGIEQGRPRLLGEGCHIVESSTFQFKGFASLADKVISHGTITLLRVNKGEIGLAWHNNEPVLLEMPGCYSYDDPNFIFVRHQNISDKIIALGSRKIVTVLAGEVGISFNRGVLEVLEPGRHILDHAEHIFDDFLSTQQKSLRLCPRKAEQQNDGRALSATGRTANANADLLVCETKDFVKVGLRADVFFSVVDPAKTIRSIRRDEIDDLVYETAVATLTNVVRSTALNDVAQNKNPSVVSTSQTQSDLQNAQATGQASAPLFFDRAHDEFLARLHDDFLDRYGLEVINIRIENFVLMDEELANSISRQALATAQTESKLANLQGQTEIATQEQERLALVQQISARAEAQALATKTDAENSARLAAAESKAQAEATGIIQRAKAEAEAIRIRAEADAAAIELKAAAEAKRAEMISRTPLGSQLALLSVYSEMMQKSSEGVQKVIYCDPTLCQNGSPFSMPTLQKLNSDLQLLNSVGNSEADDSSVRG